MGLGPRAPGPGLGPGLAAAPESCLLKLYLPRAPVGQELSAVSRIPFCECLGVVVWLARMVKTLGEIVDRLSCWPRYWDDWHNRVRKTLTSVEIQDPPHKSTRRGGRASF